ncbi:hypothetical protein Pcinc_032837 [Petrolisthes cinctipes]|uniref:Uncharacterized protein n=1 Tax=Petrolisthes cinctipes TaxID=88211 RepID=A0AAE1ETP7_PETCI|nr:hypothetical protein Pcinc_032837 [Petrolisthes cinctipes]
MWKQWEQHPHTKGQSSPGRRQSEQQPSKGIRQIPQLSSLATHRQVATPVQPLMRTFITLLSGKGKGICHTKPAGVAIDPAHTGPGPGSHIRGGLFPSTGGMANKIPMRLESQMYEVSPTQST